MEEICLIGWSSVIPSAFITNYAKLSNKQMELLIGRYFSSFVLKGTIACCFVMKINYFIATSFVKKMNNFSRIKFDLRKIPDQMKCVIIILWKFINESLKTKSFKLNCERNQAWKEI